MMKILYASIVWCAQLLWAAPACAQHLDVALPYAVAVPLGTQGDNMDIVHNVNVEVLYGFRSSRMSAGISFQLGGYDRYRKEIDWTVDGNTFITNMIVSHNLSQLGLVLRFDLTSDAPLVPYASFRSGWAMAKSQLQVRDPSRDASGEGPLNLYDEVLHTNHTFTGSLGIGARLDLAHIFGRMARNRYFAEAESFFTYGARMNYAFSERESALRNEGLNPPENPNYEVVEHDLHTTHLYQSPLSMVTFRIGMQIRLHFREKEL